MHTCVQPEDEMLLRGISVAFAGVSHKLKLTSLGSDLDAVGH